MQEVTAGNNIPSQVNVIIEIRRGEGRNKYEYDKSTGRLVLDRVNATTMRYPADYGYIPQTLCEDGDPLDALLVIDESVPHGVVVPSRPIGVLYMVDDGEKDEKMIVVPASDISSDHIQELSDLGPNFTRTVEHFYSHYKDWKNDWKGAPVSFNGWGDAAAAREQVQKAIALYKSK